MTWRDYIFISIGVWFIIMINIKLYLEIKKVRADLLKKQILNEILSKHRKILELGESQIQKEMVMNLRKDLEENNLMN